ncbi:MAG: ribonucleoside-triphosphate reductase [Candidatus Aminicenantes bacterium]|nr:ribonucleoside-triphosphate reductase [Candidatus Aminicenantes bacterium]
MALIDDIRAYAGSIGAECKDKHGKGELTRLVAERKAFLSKKKLVYSAKFEIDETAKTISFVEMLKESGAGLDGGSGFQTETYKTGAKTRQGMIAEQSVLFGKTYVYQFEFGKVPAEIRRLAEAAGYRFIPA